MKRNNILCPISSKRCSRKCGFFDQCEGKLSIAEILKLEIKIGEKIYTGKVFMDNFNLNNRNFLRDMDEEN